MSEAYIIASLHRCIRRTCGLPGFCPQALSLVQDPRADPVAPISTDFIRMRPSCRAFMTLPSNMPCAACSANLQGPARQAAQDSGIPPLWVTLIMRGSHLDMHRICLRTPIIYVTESAGTEILNATTARMRISLARSVSERHKSLPCTDLGHAVYTCIKIKKLSRLSLS